MPWVRFTQNFNFKVSPAVTYAYKAGMVKNVTRVCAEQAIEADKAHPTVNPRKQVDGAAS